VIIASIIFSALVGYGFFLCSLSHAFRAAVVSRVAFFLLPLFGSIPECLKSFYIQLNVHEAFLKSNDWKAKLLKVFRSYAGQPKSAKSLGTRK
jgi:hypothetical protein